MWRRFWSEFADVGLAILPMMYAYPVLAEPTLGDPPPGHPERPAGHLPLTATEAALWAGLADSLT